MPSRSPRAPILLPFDMRPMRRSLMSPMGLSSCGCRPKSIHLIVVSPINNTRYPKQSHTVPKKKSSKPSKRNHQRKTSPRRGRLIINPSDVSRSSHKTFSQIAMEKAKKRRSPVVSRKPVQRISPIVSRKPVKRRSPVSRKTSNTLNKTPSQIAMEKARKRHR
tara:strand:- start:1339 stop:1827 length:489 start_codon:yes stop_codon:yes gene_type:complete